MALQYSVEVRNAKLDAIQLSIGPAPIMRIWSGRKPAACSSPDAGKLLSSFDLPDGWLAPARDGTISKSGVWQDLRCDATGEPGYFRIYDRGGNCRIQGGIGQEMRLDRPLIVQGQIFTVVDFRIHDNNG